jgi:hypothetical protein
MAFLDTFNVEFIKTFIGIVDDDSFDSIIEQTIPFYAVLIAKTLDITLEDLDALPEEDQEFIAGVIAVAVACHLMTSDPQFGLKQQGYRIGDVARNFARRYTRDFENWCDLNDTLMRDLMDMYGNEGDNLYVKRRGLIDDYTTPY